MTGSHFGPAGSFQPSTPPASGDAGSNFLSAMLTAPLDAEGAQRVSAGGEHLKSLAESGGFAVNEEGFQAYIKACDFFLEGYKAHKRNIELLTQEPKMGSSDYAREIAGFNVKVAGGDHQAMIPNVDLLRDGIEKAREALVIARRNYRENEHAHTVSFTQMNKDLDNR